MKRHKLQEITEFVLASFTSQLISAMEKVINSEIKSYE